MQRAQERIYFNADKTKLVGAGSPHAAFLYAAEGDEIPDTAAEKFGLVDGRLKGPGSRKPRGAETLIGSSTLASTYEIGGKTVQLGTLVTKAHELSGQSVEEWNALPEAERDKLITAALEELQAAASTATPEKPEQRPTSKPEVQPTPKPKAAAGKAPAKKAPAKKAAPKRK